MSINTADTNPEFLDHLEYPEKTMFQMVEYITGVYPEEPAYEFYGIKTSYRRFVELILCAARAFTSLGIGRGDRVTICLPNIPQALIAFYALNRIGAAANMVHPLSAKTEITYYLIVSKSRAVVTADMFYEKVREAADSPELAGSAPLIITARMQEELPPHLALLYILKKGREYLKYPVSPDLSWKQFMRMGRKESVSLPEPVFDKEHTAVILYSGGTTGLPKGICLSDLNFNACAMQVRNAIGMEFKNGLTMLSCMPCFHGFGLGINLHTVLCYGAGCILMPTFNSRSYAQMLLKKHPSFIAGVPTIFEALLHLPEFENADLSFLKGVFCGGDSLSVELKKKIDAFLQERGADIQIREGYGLTECVTASCLTPVDRFKEGSIGLPFADMYYKIVRPMTGSSRFEELPDGELPPLEELELPCGEEGEIILTGPTLMLGYLDAEEETKKALRTLSDGRTWLLTGDLGIMDEEGYVYFRQRIKRLIITNGYNVYPGRIENLIDSFPAVSCSCVIGVPDPRRMHRVRAYIVLRDGFEETEALKEELMSYLRTHIAAYALPKEIIFRKELPKTLVGKVAYRLLEEEAEREAMQPSQTDPAAGDPAAEGGTDKRTA
ncbi:MAG: acyl--CoA ligase [Lachnospiraceae bacterium]|nr:acyl--CoA ligase [Lachnospiraceae bacterium]